MAKFHSDECFPFAIVEELRRLGDDVLTARDAGRPGIGIGDAGDLGFATANGPAAITHNHRDYIRLHLSGIAHAGMIVCTRGHDAIAMAARIHANVTALPCLNNRLVRINRLP